MMQQDTIPGRASSWQTVDGIVVPADETPALPRSAEKTAAKPVSKSWSAMVAKSDSAQRARRDSIVRAVNDSVAHERPASGIILQAPYMETVAPGEGARNTSDGLSWVYVGLAVLFCLVCLKFKKNTRYLRALVADMSEVRMRHNAFDDTVKETSFLILLDLLWICCAGVLLWKTVMLTVGDNPFWSLSIPDRPGLGIALCCGITASYAIMMTLAYTVVGNVFSDSHMTAMWVKGSLATMGLEGGILFILALLSMCYEPWTKTILIFAAAVFVAGKIIFIYKGFRIFFNQISSWLLFLYYLCSLEIVPLILTYAATLLLCSKLL